MDPPHSRDPFDPSNDPFDPNLYNGGPIVNIDGMIVLRAFCAHFYHTRIRSSSIKANTEHDVSFLALIKHSPDFFARARAVIPELQAPDPVCSNPNLNVQIFLNATRGMRGPPDKKWALLPEEEKWNDYARQGEVNLAREIVTRHQKQSSDASSHGSSMNPTMLAPGKVDYKASDPPSYLPASVESKSKSPPKKLDLANIPTFVPRNSHDAALSEELVWSPTSGTRVRRPDEIFHQSTEPRPATPLQSGQGLPPNPTSASSSMPQHPLHGSRDFTDLRSMGHRRSDSIRRSPPPQFKSTQSPLNPSASRSRRPVETPSSRHRRHNHPGEMSSPHDLDRMMEMTSLDPVAHSRDSSLSHVDNTGYPVTNLSGTNSASQVGDPRYPSSQAHEFLGAEPFSAPPSIPGYGDLHQTGQGMHGGPPSPFQSQPQHSLARSLSPFQDQRLHSMSRPAAGIPHVPTGELSHVPNTDLWTAPPSSPHYGGSQNQPPNQIIQPVPQRMIQSQIAPFMDQAPPDPSNDTLIVPPQGSMLPLDYWDMLHQREIDIRTRLQHANRPMTAQEHSYIHKLGDARVNAAASQLPVRGNVGKGKWLTELARTLRNVWRTGPDGKPGSFPPVVVARKKDFVKAIEREMARVKSREGRAPGARRDHR